MTKFLLPALCCLFSAHSAMALSLGELAPSSGLGQPLEASIPLAEADDWSAEQIKIQVSGDNASIVRAVKASIVATGEGQAVVLTTSDPIREPYVDLTIQLSWPDGRLQRDYQILLDPPQ